MTDKENIYDRWASLICIGLGITSCLGFAPFNFFFITLINIAISIYLLKKTKDEKKAFFLGFYFGIGYHFATLYWIAISFKVAEKASIFLGLLAVLLLSSFLAFLHGLCFYLIKYISNKLNDLSSALSTVFFLSIFDWIKGNIFWGFPWTPLSSIWSFNTFTLFPFSIIGSWGYSMITFSIVLGIYLLFRKNKLSILFFMPYLFVISLIFSPLNKKGSTVEEIKVRLVQPNIEQSEKWKPSMITQNMNKLFDLSLSKGIENIDMVIWPETAVPFDIKSDNLFSKVFYKKIENFKSVVFGFIRSELDENKEKLYNSFYFLKPKENQYLIHDKTKLVPFGEYNPFKRFWAIEKLTTGSTDFQEGAIINTIQITENIFVLPLICYEVIFPELPKGEKNNYNLLINITNDAWYGHTTGPYQHLALSRVRAVKEGNTLIRVANTGISAIISPSGEILSKLSLDSEGILDRKIELFAIETFYRKYGDTFFFLSVFLLGFILVILYFKGRQEN